MDKNNKVSIKEYVERSIQSVRFAVLATDGGGQPYASLVAITPIEGYHQLIFATYRDTNKYRNLMQNCRVAVLIEIRDPSKSEFDEGFVITAFGSAAEINIEENEAELNAHLNRHPELEIFLRSADCALIRVTFEKFQFVNGIDEVSWWTVGDLDAT